MTIYSYHFNESWKKQISEYFSDLRRIFWHEKIEK